MRSNWIWTFFCWGGGGGGGEGLAMGTLHIGSSDITLVSFTAPS